MSHVTFSRNRFSWDRALTTLAAWALALLWVLPLLYAAWTAFHPAEYETRFDLTAPVTLTNFSEAWVQAPFARYFLNTTVLVTMILFGQIVLGTFAAFAFARLEFRGRGILFSLVLMQLMIMPDILLVENYKTMRDLGLVDTILAIGLPYMASGFGIFLLRQTFMTIPQELDDAARIEGTSILGRIWRLYMPLGETNLFGLRLGFGLGALEQFSLAADYHQFRGNTPSDRWPVHLCFDGFRHPMVHHKRSNSADFGTLVAGLFAFSTPIRAKLHARWH